MVLSRFLSVYPLLAIAGSGRRTYFITSLNLAQVSEFSLVIGQLGVMSKHIGEDVMTLLLYAIAITAVFSSYAIKYGQPLFLGFDGILNRLGWRQREAAPSEVPAERHGGGAIVVLGYYRVARAFMESLHRHGSPLLKQLLVIDFNPEVLNEVGRLNIRGVFGDISSPDTLLHLHLDQARVILGTIPRHVAERNEQSAAGAHLPVPGAGRKDLYGRRLPGPD
mgnify:CR=1 FL=1